MPLPSLGRRPCICGASYGSPGAIPCGPEAEPIVKAVREFTDIGFTDVALIQIGGDQQEDFLAFAEKELLPALRDS